jgi:hypothetical protein
MVGKKLFRKTTPSEYVHEGSIGNLCSSEISRIFNERMGCFKSGSAADLVASMMKSEQS